MEQQTKLAAQRCRALQDHLAKEFGQETRFVRFFQDGETLFTHTEYLNRAAKVARFGFNIAQFDGATLTGHWAFLQTAPHPQTPLPHPATDHRSLCCDHDLTEFNRTLINHFTGSVLILGKTDHLDEFIDPHYLEHSVNVPANSSEQPALLQLKQRFGAVLENGQKQRHYQRRVHTVVEGNFALVCCEGDLNGVACLYADLYRLHHGKIVEHWDTIQTSISFTSQLSNSQSTQNNNHATLQNNQ